MSNEIEAKFSVTEKEAKHLIKHMHKNPKASFKYTRNEINEFFDRKNKLKNQDQVLRIRTCRTKNVIQYYVTYKGPQKRSKMKSREEIEMQIESGADFKKILKLLGFKPVFLFEKKRVSFSYQKCLVEIDCLPSLGYFCEIEGKNSKEIEAVKKDLGFSNAPLILSGYPTLLIKHNKTIKKVSKEIRF